MAASYSLNFRRPPSLWGTYARIFAARKPRLVPEGLGVPRIAAEWRGVRIDAEQLAQYRLLCGGGPAEVLPLAFPHVLASPLHLAVLSSEKFPIGLLGLLQVRNRIERSRPLDSAEVGSLQTWVEGHRETERGQEFDLHTVWHADSGEPIWSELSTFLARRAPPAGSRTVRQPHDPAPVGDPAARQSTSFRALAGLGRRYGWMAGDLNPIHLSDATARRFGFRSAIAHGMWSLARCAAELDSGHSAACVLDVQFRQPVHLPAWLLLQSQPLDSGLAFELLDSLGERVHLTGSLVSS